MAGSSLAWFGLCLYDLGFLAVSEITRVATELLPHPTLELGLLHVLHVLHAWEELAWLEWSHLKDVLVARLLQLIWKEPLHEGCVVTPGLAKAVLVVASHEHGAHVPLAWLEAHRLGSPVVLEALTYDVLASLIRSVAFRPEINADVVTYHKRLTSLAFSWLDAHPHSPHDQATHVLKVLGSLSATARLHPCEVERFSATDSLALSHELTRLALAGRIAHQTGPRMSVSVRDSLERPACGCPHEDNPGLQRDGLLITNDVRPRLAHLIAPSRASRYTVLMTYAGPRGWRLIPLPVEDGEISPESSREDLKRASANVPFPPSSRFKPAASSSASSLPVVPVLAHELKPAGLASPGATRRAPGEQGPGFHVVRQKGSTPGPLVAKKSA